MIKINQTNSTLLQKSDKAKSIEPYQSAIEYLFTQLPMFQKQGKSAFKKDLTNISALLTHLEDPHRKLKCIHIAGTNGKGTVSHLIASILQEYGYRVGLYTSPHYKDFRERIKINGALIRKKDVVQFTNKIKTLSNHLQPSFFEITVAMAFEYFAREKVDFAVIETGLGGRLDSTNVIKPVLSVITNISYDHMEILGDTLDKIAAEKAGIIKYKVPVVVGEKSVETAEVFTKKAKEEKTELFFAEDMLQQEDFNFHSTSPLENPFRAQNQNTALAAMKVLEKHGIIPWNSTYIKNGIDKLKENTYYIGRWEVLGKRPLILADSAHNEAGIKGVFEVIKNLRFDKLHLVLGFVNDKEVEKILRLLPKSAQYYFVKADIPRGLDAQTLKEKAAQLDLKGRKYVSVKNGLKAAKRNAGADDFIYIGGSIFVLAEVL